MLRGLCSIQQLGVTNAHDKKGFRLDQGEKARIMYVFAPLGIGNAEKEEYNHRSNGSCTEIAGHSHSRDEKDANDQVADSSKLEVVQSSTAWNAGARREETGTLIDTPQRRCDEAVVISEENSSNAQEERASNWTGGGSIRLPRGSAGQ